MKQHTSEHACSISCARALPAVSLCSLQRTSCLISCSPSVKWRCNCCSGACAWHRNQPSLSLSVSLYPPLFPSLGLKTPILGSGGLLLDERKIISISDVLRTFHSLPVPSGGFTRCRPEIFRSVPSRASRGRNAPSPRPSLTHLVCHFDCSHAEAA